MLRHYTATNANINSSAFRLDQARAGSHLYHHRPNHIGEGFIIHDMDIPDMVLVAARLCKRDVAAAAAAAAAGNQDEAERLMARAKALRALMHQLDEVI